MPKESYTHHHHHQRRPRASYYSDDSYSTEDEHRKYQHHLPNSNLRGQADSRAYIIDRLCRLQLNPGVDVEKVVDGVDARFHDTSIIERVLSKNVDLVTCQYVLCLIVSFRRKNQNAVWLDVATSLDEFLAKEEVTRANRPNGALIHVALETLKVDARKNGAALMVSIGSFSVLNHLDTLSDDTLSQMERLLERQGSGEFWARDIFNFMPVTQLKNIGWQKSDPTALLRKARAVVLADYFHIKHRGYHGRVDSSPYPYYPTRSSESPARDNNNNTRNSLFEKRHRASNLSPRSLSPLVEEDRRIRYPTAAEAVLRAMSSSESSHELLKPSTRRLSQQSIFRRDSPDGNSPRNAMLSSACCRLADEDEIKVDCDFLIRTTVAYPPPTVTPQDAVAQKLLFCKPNEEFFARTRSREWLWCFEKPPTDPSRGLRCGFLEKAKAIIIRRESDVAKRDQESWSELDHNSGIESVPIDGSKIVNDALVAGDLIVPTENRRQQLTTVDSYSSTAGQSPAPATPARHVTSEPCQESLNNGTQEMNNGTQEYRILPGIDIAKLREMPAASLEEEQVKIRHALVCQFDDQAPCVDEYMRLFEHQKMRLKDILNSLFTVKTLTDIGVPLGHALRLVGAAELLRKTSVAALDGRPYPECRFNIFN